MTLKIRMYMQTGQLGRSLFNWFAGNPVRSSCHRREPLTEHPAWPGISRRAWRRHSALLTYSQETARRG